MQFYNKVCTSLTDIVWMRLYSTAREEVVDEVLKLHRRLVPFFQNNMRLQLKARIEFPDGG